MPGYRGPRRRLQRPAGNCCAASTPPPLGAAPLRRGHPACATKGGSTLQTRSPEILDSMSSHARRDRKIVAVGDLLGVGAGVSPTLKIFAPTASSTRALRTRKRLTP